MVIASFVRTNQALQTIMSFNSSDTSMPAVYRINNESKSACYKTIITKTQLSPNRLSYSEGGLGGEGLK